MPDAPKTLSVRHHSSSRRIVVVVVPPVDELDLVGPSASVQLGQSTCRANDLHHRARDELRTTCTLELAKVAS